MRKEWVAARGTILYGIGTRLLGILQLAHCGENEDPKKAQTGNRRSVDRTASFITM